MLKFYYKSGQLLFLTQADVSLLGAVLIDLYLMTHASTIHCSNRSIKSFIQLISMQISMLSGITMVGGVRS